MIRLSTLPSATCEVSTDELNSYNISAKVWQRISEAYQKVGVFAPLLNHIMQHIHSVSHRHRFGLDCGLSGSCISIFTW